MDTTTIKITRKDKDYLDKLKNNMKLRSKSAALELVLKLIRQQKLESELR